MSKRLSRCILSRVDQAAKSSRWSLKRNSWVNRGDFISTCEIFACVKGLGSDCWQGLARLGKLGLSAEWNWGNAWMSLLTSDELKEAHCARFKGPRFVNGLKVVSLSLQSWNLLSFKLGYKQRRTCSLSTSQTGFCASTFRALKASSRWQVACYMTKVC